MKYKVPQTRWGVLVLAWLSFLLAIVGGLALPATFFGDLISGTAGMFWDWLAPSLFMLGIAFLIKDLMDGRPDWYAVTIVILLPSIGQAVHGELGAKVHEWGQHMRATSAAHMGHWVGTGSIYAVAIVSIGVAIIFGLGVIEGKRALKQAQGATSRDAYAGARG